jgi:hypothetical protein
MATYPTYTFAYAAIGESLFNLTLIGSTLYGYVYSKSDITALGAIEKTGTVVSDEINNISGMKSDMITFLQGYESSTYNGTGNLTIKAMQSSNTYYVFNTPTTGTDTWTVTFDDDGYGSDAVFYIYNTGNLNLYNIQFEVSSTTNPNNIYVLCDANIKFYSTLEYYGNFIANGLTVGPGITPTLYGTASAMNGDVVFNTGNPSVDPYGYLTIQYTTPCFMEGTKILTDKWYTSVEDLQVGDWVITNGAISEKGHIVEGDTPMQVRNIRKSSRKPSPSTSPIMITKHAFGINKPFEDLYVSPNHGLFNSKGQLYPAKKFINDTTIFQNHTIDLITYFHIELEDHFAITANGVLTESYLNPRGQAPPSRSARSARAPPPQTPPPCTTPSQATAPLS